MTENRSFRDHCLVACAILQPELSHLQEEGFLDAKKILYIPAGLHIKTDCLEERLTAQLQKALKVCDPDKIIVVQGRKCFVSTDDPTRRIDDIIREQEPRIKRVQADYGYDMLAGKEERNQIAAGGDEGRVLWFTPGWLKNWKTIYQRYVGWDKADANANFPGYYDEIVVLDGLNVAETYQTERVEDILEIFDWMGVPVRCQPITLDRLKGLLLDALADDGSARVRRPRQKPHPRGPEQSQTGQTGRGSSGVSVLRARRRTVHGPEPGPRDRASEAAGYAHRRHQQRLAHRARGRAKGAAPGRLGLVRLHRLTTAISYTQCNHCHDRGNYNLLRMRFLERNDLPTPDFVSATERRLIECYQPIGQFTRCEWELDCVDCHTAREAMGDGDIYSNQADAQHIQCRTCHGTLEEPPPLVTITDPDDVALRQARVNGNYALHLGDQVVVTARGEKLGHVRRAGEQLILTMKATGQTYVVPLVQGSSCEQKPDEQVSHYCHECHAYAH